jgi:hypothetical protein
VVGPVWGYFSGGAVVSKQVEVGYASVDNTTLIDKFVASHVSSQVFDYGRAILHFEDGADDQGPVSTVQYTKVYRIIIRSE